MKTNNPFIAAQINQPYHSLEQTNNLMHFAEIFLLFMLLLCLWSQYAFIGNILNTRGINYINVITLPLDRQIAFSNYWSLFYSAALIIPFMFGWFIFIRSRFDLVFAYRLFLSCLFILLIHYAIYFIFPTCKLLWLEPGFPAFWQQIQTPGLLNANTRFVLSITSPWNSFPSYHIGSAWIIFRYTFERFKKSGWIFLVWFLGMCAGTLTLKVHVIMDGVVAIIISEMCYQVLKLKAMQPYLKKFTGIYPRKPILYIYLAGTLLITPWVLYELITIKPLTVPQFVAMAHAH